MTSPYDDVILATSGLVGYWPLDEPSGTSAADAKSANHGTIVNGSTKSVSLGFSAGDVGMTFVAASSQHVTIPNSAAYQFGTGDYSIECWFFRASDPSTEEALIQRGDATDHGFEQYLGDGGRYLNSRLGGAYAQTAYPGWAWGGVWHHAVTTMDRDGNGVIYIDGSASGSPVALSGQSAVSVSESATTYLGRTPGGTKYLTGGIAKVALYNVALSAATVAAHYAARTATAGTDAPAGNAAATGASSAPTPAVKPNAQVAAATAAALLPAMPVLAHAGHATADGWASQGEGAELDVDPATIEATAAAGAASAAVAVPIGHASATGAAGAPTPGAGAPAGIASFNATAEAHDATVEVVAPTVIAEHASATGAASDATPGLSLPAEHLAATAEASGIGASVAVSPSVASATGAAQTATATVPGVAGTAMVQGAAQAPSTSVKASAGHASASASADAVAIAMAVYPAAASAIAAAYPLQAAVVASAGIAQATGATYDIRPPFDWGGVRVYLNPAPAPSAVLGPAPSPSAVMGDT